MLKKLNGFKLTTVLIISIICMSFGFVFADTIYDVITNVVNRVTSVFNSTGDETIASVDSEIDKMIQDAEKSIAAIEEETKAEFKSELTNYKIAQLEKKSKEIEDMLLNIKEKVNAKKIEKLEEYKSKIDQRIEDEYDKKLKTLIK